MFFFGYGSLCGSRKGYGEKETRKTKNTTKEGMVESISDKSSNDDGGA